MKTMGTGIPLIPQVPQIKMDGETALISLGPFDEPFSGAAGWSSVSSRLTSARLEHQTAASILIMICEIGAILVLFVFSKEKRPDQTDPGVLKLK
jgi:hypothetical protein